MINRLLVISASIVIALIVQPAESKTEEVLGPKHDLTLVQQSKDARQKAFEKLVLVNCLAAIMLGKEIYTTNLVELPEESARRFIFTPDVPVYITREPFLVLIKTSEASCIVSDYDADTAKVDDFIDYYFDGTSTPFRQVGSQGVRGTDHTREFRAPGVTVLASTSASRRRAQISIFRDKERALNAR